EDPQGFNELFNAFDSQSWRGAPHGAINHLTVGNDGNCRLAGSKLFEPLSKRRPVASANITANIGIEQIPRGHHRPLRSSGGRVSLMSSKTSRGIAISAS